MVKIKVILKSYFLLTEKCWTILAVLILQSTMLTETYAYWNCGLALIKFTTEPLKSEIMVLIMCKFQLKHYHAKRGLFVFNCEIIPILYQEDQPCKNHQLILIHNLYKWKVVFFFFSYYSLFMTKNNNTVPIYSSPEFFSNVILIGFYKLFGVTSVVFLWQWIVESCKIMFTV